MKRAILFAVLLLGTGAVIVQAQEETGQGLSLGWHSFEKISGSGGSTGTDLPQAAMYMGFVNASVQAIRYLPGLSRKVSPLSLPPVGSQDQMYAIVGKYLDAHPKALSMPAFRLVLLAVLAAFPPLPPGA